MSDQTPAPVVIKIPGFNALFFVRFIDRVLAFARQKLTASFYELCRVWLVRIGHYALLAGAVLGLFLATVMSVQQDSLHSLLAGLAWVCLILALQYTAVKFMAAGDALIASAPNQLESPAFLDCFALLNLVGGLVAFLWFTIVAGRLGDANWFWFGLSVTAFCVAMALVTLNPRLLNMTVSASATADEEALSILSFLTKAFLKIVPLCFGLWAVAGAVGLAIASIDILRNTGPDATLFFMGSTAASLVVGAAVLPLVAYVAFLLYYLTIAVIRAVLVIPAKLDALRSSQS